MPANDGDYYTDKLTDAAIDFIERHKDRPFFAFLSFYAVHAPVQTTKALWRKYRDKATAAGPQPEDRFLIDRTSPVRQVQDHPLYGGLVESMDEAVGTVLTKLDELELTQNTIVVFTSDNGGVSAGDNKATSNLPLRGGKGRQWEGGIREPCYIVWPQTIAPGSLCDTPVTGTDFFPTLLGVTGQQPLANQHVDGVSLEPLLHGGTIDDRNLYWHYPHYGNQGGEPSSIITRGDWKLIHYYEDDRDELYNIALDPGEAKNLTVSQPERAKRMRYELDQWLLSVDARRPTVNQHFDPTKDKQQQQQQIRTREVTLPRLEREHAAFLKTNYEPQGGWWEDTGK